MVNSGIADVRYIDIDIPPTSYVAQHYLTELLGEANVATYADTKHLAHIDIQNLPLSAVTQSAPPDGHLLGFKVHHSRM